MNHNDPNLLSIHEPYFQVAALMSGSAVHTDGIYLSEVLQAKA